jgi:hypothetical protein
VSYHHILPLEDYPELKYAVHNLVPICTEHHNETEHKIRQGLPQPNYKEIRGRVVDELHKLGKKSD